MSHLEFGSSARHCGRLWGLVLIVAALAGAIAWFGGELLHGIFKAPAHEVITMGYKSSRVSPRDAAIADAANAALVFSLLGGLLGLGMGLAGGLARGALREGLRAGLLGLIVGWVLTTLATVPAVFFHSWYFGEAPLTSDLIVPMLIHAAAWGSTGAVAGWALARGLGVPAGPIILGGLAGAVLGAVIFEIGGATLFPTDGTTFPVSLSTGSRLFARMAVALPVAVLTAWSATAGRKGAEPIANPS